MLQKELAEETHTEISEADEIPDVDDDLPILEDTNCRNTVKSTQLYDRVSREVKINSKINTSLKCFLILVRLNSNTNFNKNNATYFVNNLYNLTYLVIVYID